jgi:glutathione S-transferase
MSSQPKPEIILFDLACAKGTCFSNNVLRIRLMLNYKRIPYKTVFLEFQDLEPTFKSFGIPPQLPSSFVLYTVPTIQITSTGKYVMDSAPISRYLKGEYPYRPIVLDSNMAQEIKKQVLLPVNIIFDTAIAARVIRILKPETQVYFRRSREERLGRTFPSFISLTPNRIVLSSRSQFVWGVCWHYQEKLEDLLDDPKKEEDAWKSVDEELRAGSDFILQSHGDGPYALGSQIAYIDFWFAGFLEITRVVNEGVVRRFCQYPGFKALHDACRPFMDKRD